MTQDPTSGLAQPLSTKISQAEIDVGLPNFSLAYTTTWGLASC